MAKVETKYGVKLPRKVVAVDVGSKGDLYVRFEHVPKPIGEATDDGLAILFYENEHRLVGVELLDAEPFM